MRRRIWKERLAVLLALVLVWNVFADHLVSVRASQDAEGAQTYSDVSDGNLSGDQEGFNLHSFGMYLVEGNTKTPITDDTEVYGGANVEVTFQWTLNDSLRWDGTDEGSFPDQEFTINTKEDFDYQGLNIPGMKAGESTSPLPLYATDQGKVVGSYYMEEGIIHITITDYAFYQTEKNRYGGVSFSGTVEKTDNPEDDGVSKEISFGTASAHPTYYLTNTESSASVSKSTNGKVTTDGSNYYQSFTVTVKAQNGTITDLNLTDSVSPAGMLSNPTDVVVTASDVTGVDAKSYSSLNDLLAAIGASTIYMDQSITFTYTMEVSPDVYTQGIYGGSNTISGTYETNHGTSKDVTASTWVSVQQPSISKNASDYQMRDDKGYVTWTITVNLGDYYTGESDKLEDYIDSITDIPVTGLAEMTEFELNPADFVQDRWNPAVFTYNVETQVAQNMVGQITDKMVKNKVSMTTKDNTVYTSNEAGYTIKGEPPYVTKTLTGLERTDEGLHATWNIAVTGIPEGLTGLRVNDEARHWVTGETRQILQYDIVVDGKQVVDKDGNILDADVIKQIQYYDSPAAYGDIYFTDEYVAKAVSNNNGTINITIQTLVTGDTIGKEYGNGAKAYYSEKDSNDVSSTPESRATFRDTTNILLKESSVVSGKDAIDYQIKVIVPTLGLDETAIGQEFVIEDILPAGMELGSDGASVTLTDQWGNKFADIACDSPAQTSVTGTDGEETTKLTFTVRATQDWLSKVQDYPGSTLKGYYLVIKYRGELIDRAAFIKAGEIETFTNTASGTYAGVSIGADSTTDQLTPTQIMDKTAEYSQSSAPYIKYTVSVNTEAVTLLDGTAKLAAVDTIGTALKFVDADYFTDDSFKQKYAVQVLDGSTGQALIAGTDYEYKISANRRAINFTLPDSRYIKLVYWAYAAPGTHLTAENSTNSFSLTGESSDALSAAYAFDMVAYTPNGWAGSEVGSIEIFKFWTDENEQIALDGSVFKLIKVKYNETTKTLEPDETGDGSVLHERIEITDENRVGEEGSGRLVITGLPVNQIMALYEIEADTGFALNKEPYYFVLEGSTVVSIPEGLDITKYTSGSTIEYENFEADNFSVPVSKVGLAGGKEIAGAELTITGTTAEGNAITAITWISGSDGTAADGELNPHVVDLYPGTYTLTETTVPDGYVQATPIEFAVAEDGTITVGGNTVTEVVMEDEEIVFKVNKLEATGTEEVAGAVLAVYKASDVENGVPKDSADAVASWTSKKGVYRDFGNVLVAGESYVLIETYAPAGYTYMEPVEFSVGADGTITISGTEPGQNADDIYLLRDGKISVKLSKVDSADNTGLSGATIAVYSADDVNADGTVKDGATALDTWTSVADESHDFGSALEVDKDYVFVELSAPNGYSVTDNIRFTVNRDGTVQTASTVDTDADGVILMKDAAIAGDYGTILLTKTVTGDLTGKDLEGKLKFTVESEEPTLAYNKEFILGEDGFVYNATSGRYELTITNLAVGTYKVTEVLNNTTPDNMIHTVSYTVDASATGTTEEIDSIAVTKDTETTVAYTNDYKYITGTLQVAKKFTEATGKLNWDDDIKDSLSFEIYDATGAQVAGSPIKGDALTEENGVYKSGVLTLPIGDYTVKEINTAIPNYAVITTYSITVDGAAGTSGNIAVTGAVTVGEDDTVVVTFDNTYSYSGTYPVTVSKIELTDGKELAGAVLTITGTKADGSSIDAITWTSGSDGTANGELNPHVVNLYPGTYVLTETTAPLGYAKDEAITFTVEADGTVKVAGAEVSEVVMEDEAISLKLTKVDLDDTTKELDGAVIALYKAADINSDGTVKTGAQSVDSWTTVAGTSHDFGSELEAGEDYVLVETAAPEGYAVTTNIAFTVKDDGTVVLTNAGTAELQDDVIIMKDAVRVPDPGRLVLTKIVRGVLDKSKLEGNLQFRVENADSNTAAFDRTYTLGEGGFAWNPAEGKYILTIPDLPIGTYKVTEVLGNTTPGNMACTVTYTIDSVPAVNGSGTESGNIAIGENDTITVEYTNEYRYRTGSLKVTKTFSETYNRLTWDEIAPNLSFNIYDSTGTEIPESPIKGTDLTLNGTVYESRELVLPIDTYKVEEVHTTIGGYEITTNYSITAGGAAGANGNTAVTNNFVLGEGDAITVAYTNSYQYTGTYPVPVRKVSLTDGKEIEGAELTITGTKASGGAIAPISWETQRDAAAGTLASHVVNLYPGTYTLTETSVPVGYVKADSIDFTVEDDGSIVVGNTTVTEIVMEDAEITVKLNKVDMDDHSVEVNGAVVAVFNAGDVDADGILKEGATPLDSWTSKVGEVHDFGNVLETDKSYVFVETRVPGNYEVAENIAFTVNADGTITITSPANPALDGDVILMEDKQKEGEFGTLVITKVLKGDVDRTLAESAITFKVTNNTTKESDSYKLSEFKYDANTKVYSLELICKAGGYTVEEAVSDVSGYTLSKVTYTVGADTGSGKVAVAAVPVEDSVTVAFEDTYEKVVTEPDDTEDKKDDVTDSDSDKDSDNTDVGEGGEEDNAEEDNTEGDNDEDADEDADDEDDEDDDEEDTSVENSSEVISNSLTKTGDDTPLGLWMALFVGGFAGLATGCVVLASRRRRE